MAIKRKILLLSAYDAASHQQWRNTLAENLPQYEWTQVALPGRHFAWRSRGNSLTFAFLNAEKLKQSYDLVIATSMVDLASLRGFIPHLGSIKTIAYFHENQFSYPVSATQPNLLNAQLTSIYTALCADRIVFNSSYNRESYLQGVDSLMKKMPDGVPPELAKVLEEKSSVLPVPIEMIQREGENKLLGRVKSENQNKWSPTILWNHRWEYDKQPQVFFDALKKLKENNVRFKLNIIGQSYRKVPSCFNLAKEAFSQEILNWGFQSRAAYEKCLSESDIVVSSALHDFQGLSMLEAISAGCVPIAPDRLVYQEYVPESLRYNSSTNLEKEAVDLSELLIKTILENTYQKVSVEQYSKSELIPRYAKLIESLLGDRLLP